MKVVVFTLGCKVNSYESSCIINGLEQMGFEVYDKLQPADMYILNTCAITAEAEKKSRQAVARVLKFNPNAKVYVLGCASQSSPESFTKKKNVKVIMGTQCKDKLLEMLNEDGVFVENWCGYYQKYLPKRDLKSRAYVKIQDGCENFCSYCLIPYLRGKPRSRAVEDIIREIDYLKPKEVVLTGINLSAYNYNGVDLAGLMERLTCIDCRIRLGSLEVNVITENFLQVLSRLKDFAPHFHLSLQSGSTKVLSEMNRHYTKEQFLHKCELIRKYFPFAGITTDIIVGFSTETNSDFEESYETCKMAEFSDMHCFPYSLRKGTKAEIYAEIDANVKQLRLEKMLKLKSELKRTFIEKCIGQTMTFLPEYKKDGFVEGYTENYLRVYVDCDFNPEIAKIKIIEPFKDGAKAIII